jgi:glutamine amidotransferase
MIAIIDYQAGNIRSVENALARLGCSYCLTADPEVIRSADRVILPGVGNAAEAMRSLTERGLVPVIRSLRRPVLGICVGMQVLCRDSEEGPCEGIGLFDAHVRRFPSAGQGLSLPGSREEPCRGMPSTAGQGLSPSGSRKEPFRGMLPEGDSPRPAAKVPHMGWNALGNLDGKLFTGMKGGSYVYFVHSYYPTLGPDTVATCRHGEVLFSAALRYENFYGTQFHPEKSGAVGEQILRNFLSL